jgi:WhiB family redox-sensing transcriptional regulator
MALIDTDTIDRSFMNRAACKGMDPEMFMPVRGENLKIRAAKVICKQCPVQSECAEYGLQLAMIYDTHGIFGGLTRSERETILRERGRKMVTWSGSRLKKVPQ